MQARSWGKWKRWGAGLLAALACAHGAVAQVCVTPGTDGPVTIAGTGTIVNTYYAGSSASVGAGSTSIGIGTASGAATGFAVGDMALVIQMQGATYNNNNFAISNNSTYGDGGSGSGITSLNGVGRYEFALVTSVTGGTLGVMGGGGGGLINSYSNSGNGRYQVVRVPQYSSLTVTGSIAPGRWTGNAGGVVAIDVAGTLTFTGGAINAANLGFRGGLGRGLAGSGATVRSDDCVASTVTAHGVKGEGIAGQPRDMLDPVAGAADAAGADNYSCNYPPVTVTGQMARGAPGNAGGGGSDEHPSANDNNSGGGGGAGFANGGKGGNSYSTNLPFGGYGGTGVAQTVGLLTMGGGGGAGSRNNSSGILSSGGAGGGIVIVRAGRIVVTSTGTIDVSGKNANAYAPLNDAGGGGGGGGTALILASQAGSGTLTINASGGNGSNAWPTDTGGIGDAHGPGGGGGGGYVAVSGATVSATANISNGVHGTTTSAAFQYGAADGSLGTNNTGASLGQVPGVSTGSACYPQLTVTKQTVPAQPVSILPNSVIRYHVTLANAAGKATATSVTLTDPLPGTAPNPFTGTPQWQYQTAPAYTLTVGGGTTRPTTVDPANNATVPAWSTFSVPGGGTISLDFSVLVPTGSNAGTYQNPMNVTYLDPTRTTAAGTVTPGGTYAGIPGTVGGSNYIATSSVQEDVQVASAGALVVNKAFTPSADRTSPYNTTLSITISNPSSFPITGIAFTDNYPGVAGKPMRNVTPGTSSACNGTNNLVAANANPAPPSATSPSGTLVMTGGSLPPGQSCTITVPVLVTDASNPASSTYANTVTVSATNAGSGTATGDFIIGTAAVGPPVITKTIGGSAAATIGLGDTTTLTVTVSNPNTATALTLGSALVDAFPSGLIGGTLGAHTCNGITSGNWTSTAGSLTLASGTIINAGQICTADIIVSSNTPGFYTNTVGPTSVSTPAGVPASNTSSATLRVLGPSVSKTFTPATIVPGGTSTMVITVSNPNTNPDQMTGVGISDTYPAGLVNQGAATLSCPSGGALNAAISGGVGFTGGTLNTGQSCTITQVVTAATAASYANTTGQATAVVNGSTIHSPTASATLTVSAIAPTVSKAFSIASVNPGGTATLTITLGNTNPAGSGTVKLTSSFTDNLPTSDTGQPMTIATAASLATTCGGALTSSAVGVSPAFVTLASGSTIPAGGCTISVDVKVNNTVNSAYVNTIPAGALQTNVGNSPASASATLLVDGPPVVTKAFSPASIAAGGTSTLTVTLKSPSGAPITNVKLTDNLPTGVLIAGAPAITNTCSGTITTRATTPNAVELTSGTVPAGGCSFSVNVTAAAAGVYDNNILATDLTSSGGTTGTGILATARLTVGGASISGRIFTDTGTGGGLANDGILGAGEGGTNPGVANVVVRLTNCAVPTPVVLATVQTDGSGNYSIPGPAASTNPVCVVADSQPGWTNTGASVNTTALPSNVPTAAPTVSYTFCRDASFTCATTQQVRSIKFSYVTGTSYSSLNFGQVQDNQYVSNGAQQAPAGNTLSYPQTYTANTAGTITFTPVVTSTVPNITGWNEVLHLDTNCDGSIAPTETTIVTAASTFPVTAGTKICLVLTEFTPAGAPDNSQRVVTVTSNFTYTNSNPALPAQVLAVTDITTIGSADGLTLRKEVCNSTVQAAAGAPCDPALTGATAGRGFSLSNTGAPNDVLIYRIIYTNPTNKPSTNLVVNDTTPPYTVHAAPATCPAAQTPAGLGACVIVQPGAIGQSGNYRWTFSGTLNATSAGVVLMTVSVAP